MSEEEMRLEENLEHEVIDRLKNLEPMDFDYNALDASYVDAMLKARNIILDLYNKEKEKNNTLENLLQGNLYEMYKYYKELANSYQANSISKDKINTRIEEIEKTFPNDILFTREFLITELKGLLEE
jgi:hypothetical protein